MENWCGHLLHPLETLHNVPTGSTTVCARPLTKATWKRQQPGRGMGAACVAEPVPETRVLATHVLPAVPLTRKGAVSGSVVDGSTPPVAALVSSAPVTQLMTRTRAVVACTQGRPAP